MLEMDPEAYFGKEQPCFGCSPSHEIGFRLRFARSDAGDEVITRFTPGARHQGPPGLMHGGLVTTLADELAAWTVVGLLEKFAFTAQIAGKLLRPVRVGVEVVGRGRISSSTTRTVRVDVRLRQEEVDAFTGEFVMALFDRKGTERLLGQPLPEHWLRFVR
jgi:acyl-coenzyme A thioesterase PaaI-like protein